MPQRPRPWPAPPEVDFSDADGGVDLIVFDPRENTRVGYQRPVSAEQAQSDHDLLLRRFQEFDPTIVDFGELLLSEHNQEWFVEVVYKDGQRGAIEGKADKILRRTYSRQKIELMAEYDPDIQREVWAEPREE